MILLLGFLMMTGVAVAQQLQVQGKVTDATGEGLIGASVLVKGTTSGVITDIDGNYVLLNVNTYFFLCRLPNAGTERIR